MMHVKIASRLLMIGAALLGVVGPLAAQDDKAQQQESRLLSSVRQLTFEGRRAGEGYYSRDGKMMIFQSEREPGNPFYQIYLMDLETGDVERMSPGLGKTTCAWIHPDNDRVLFASTHGDARSAELQRKELEFRASGKSRRYAWDYDEHFEVWERDLKTGQLTNLTNTRGYDAEGSYSPDGKLIAWASNRSGYEQELSEADRQRFRVDKSLFMEIYVANADGSDVRRITHARGYDGGPFFSADGKKLCWRRFSEDGLTAEVFTANVDGGEQRQLTRLGAMSWAPFFHPSGRYLIFATNRHGFGNFELYLVDAKGLGEPVRVTYTDGFDGLASWSPDGKTLTWTSNRTAKKQSQIFLAKWDHQEALRLIEASVKKARSPQLPEEKELDAADLAPGKTARIAPAEVRSEVQRLCAPKMGGRQTGTPGERLATAYVAARFRAVGLEPAAPGGGFFHEFTFTLPAHGDQEERTLTGRNVIARLPATQTPELPAIIVGAHLDHLGKEAHNSRARAEEKGRIHPGADDNASGVAALIEIAEYLQGLREKGKLACRRPIVFAAWSGEEMGLHGSKSYLASVSKLAGDPEDLRGSVAAYLNMDMVGRLRDHVILSGVGSSPVWRRVIEQRNAPVGLALSLNDDSRMPTDSTSFHLRGVPALTAFTGAHDDYHTPRDVPDKLNYEGASRIARFFALVARGLARDAQPLPFVDRPMESAPSRPMAQRAWLGSIPDYAKAPIPGLRLSGVAAGGPCAKAGLKGGDIVVELAGVKVTDIHTYAAALEELKPDVEVGVSVMRDGKRLDLRVTPGRRQE